MDGRAPVEGADLDDPLGVVALAEAEHVGQEVAEPAGGPRLQPAGGEQLARWRGWGRGGRPRLPSHSVKSAERRAATPVEAPLQGGGGGGRVAGRVAAAVDVGGEGGEVPVEQRRRAVAGDRTPAAVGGDHVDDGGAESGEVGAVDGVAGQGGGGVEQPAGRQLVAAAAQVAPGEGEEPPVGRGGGQGGEEGAVLVVDAGRPAAAARPSTARARAASGSRASSRRGAGHCPSAQPDDEHGVEVVADGAGQRPVDDAVAEAADPAPGDVELGGEAPGGTRRGTGRVRARRGRPGG